MPLAIDRATKRPRRSPRRRAAATPALRRSNRIDRSNCDMAATMCRKSFALEQVVSNGSVTEMKPTPYEGDRPASAPCAGGTRTGGRSSTRRAPRASGDAACPPASGQARARLSRARLTPWSMYVPARFHPRRSVNSAVSSSCSRGSWPPSHPQVAGHPRVPITAARG